jgi:hypothetical protein
MRRSRRGTGAATPKNIDEFLEQARRLAQDDIDAEEQRATRARNYAAACAGMVKHEGPPFRLLDLPPELRLEIFEYMVVRPGMLDIDDFVLPLITATSKQVRTETLASFFALNTFRALIETNICQSEYMDSFLRRYHTLPNARARAMLGRDQELIEKLYRTQAESGQVWMTENNQTWLEKIPYEIAVFRNIQICTADAFYDVDKCDLNLNENATSVVPWTLRLQRLGRHDDLVISLAHSNQMRPHVINWEPSWEVTRAFYYGCPRVALNELFLRNHVRFHNFDLNALRFVASVIGHWGVFEEPHADAPPRPTVRIQTRARKLVRVQVEVQEAQEREQEQSEDEDEEMVEVEVEVEDEGEVEGEVDGEGEVEGEVDVEVEVEVESEEDDDDVVDGWGKGEVVVVQQGQYDEQEVDEEAA